MLENGNSVGQAQRQEGPWPGPAAKTAAGGVELERQAEARPTPMAVTRSSAFPPREHEAMGKF